MLDKQSVLHRMVSLLQSTPPSVLVPAQTAVVMLSVPGVFLLEMAEGYVFGVKKAFAIALAGKVLGCGSAFALGRYAQTSQSRLAVYLRESVEAWPAAKLIVQGADRGGAFTVFVLTMAPVPCAIKNYGLAVLTSIPFATYAPIKILCLAPTTYGHVYSGSLAKSIFELSSGAGATLPLLAAGTAVAGTMVCSTMAGVYLTGLSEASADEEAAGEPEVPSLAEASVGLGEDEPEGEAEC